MIRIKLFILLIISSFINVHGQVEEEVNQELIALINKTRAGYALPELEVNELLNAAAFDQAKVIAELKKVVHEQEQSKKKSLDKRILFYEGLYAEAGENAAIVSIGSREVVEPKGPRVPIKSPQMAIRAAIASWLDEEESRLNLLDPQFYQLGTAVIINEETEYVFVAVIASLPYENPGVKKLALDKHGIKAYEKASCSAFLEKYSSLPELLSDALTIENKEVLLNYHNLGFINEMLSESGSGIAVDVIQRKQFNCEEGNRLFPGSINKGYLMSPIRKGRLNAQNQITTGGGLKVSLGKLPDFYQEEDELNLVIINKERHCETVPYNRIETYNKRWFNLPYALAGRNDSTVFVWNDSLHLAYPLLGEEKWQQKWNQDYKALNEFNYQVKGAKVIVESDPINGFSISDSTIREMLNLSAITTIQYKVNWDSLNSYVKGSYYQLELAELSKEEQLTYLKESTKKDKKLDDFLKSLNLIKLELSGSASIDATISTADELEMYRLLLKNNEIEPALFLQARLIQKVRDGKLAAGKLPKADPSQRKLTLPLINNQIVLEKELGKQLYNGNSLNIAFLELHLIDKSQATVRFNYQIAQLKQWSENLGKITRFETWLKEFKKLANTSLPKESYAKGLFNYYLVAADYYYEKEKFEERKKAFRELMKRQKAARLSNEEILAFAKYLCFQDQFSNAIKVLLSEIKKENCSPGNLFYFLQIAQYDKELVREKLYLEQMERASKNYPVEFCKLFGKDKMGIQPFSNKSVKDLYCTTCSTAK